MEIQIWLQISEIDKKLSTTKTVQRLLLLRLAAFHIYKYDKNSRSTLCSLMSVLCSLNIYLINRWLAIVLCNVKCKPLISIAEKNSAFSLFYNTATWTHNTWISFNHVAKIFTQPQSKGRSYIKSRTLPPLPLITRPVRAIKALLFQIKQLSKSIELSTSKAGRLHTSNRANTTESFTKLAESKY